MTNKEQINKIKDNAELAWRVMGILIKVGAMGFWAMQTSFEVCKLIESSAI